MILVTPSSFYHREEQERRGDLGGMMLRLPRGVYPEICEILRGVYPEWRFFDRLRMSGTKGSE